MAEILKLTLLGQPQPSLGETFVIGFVSSKAQALLYYLAVTARPHARDALASLLWSDVPDQKAKKSLRGVLGNLRKLVGPHLLITRQSVAFNRERPYWLDVEVFRSTLDTDHPRDLNLLRKVVGLYRDDFLTGFHVRNAPAFEEWMLVQRELLRGLAIRGLYTLVEQYTIQDENAAGLACVTRLLTLEPWREEAHRQKIVLLAHGGQRSAALAQYKICRRTLADEFGVEPSVETTAQYERVRAGLLPELPSRQGDEASLLPFRPIAYSPCHDWGESPEIGAFYGRETELAQLERWLIADRCCLVTILGMGGQGKTTLAARLTRSLAEQPAAGYFERIIWRSLLNAPPPADTLWAFIRFLSPRPLTDMPDSPDECLRLLFDYLCQHRCLLILDNVESVLQEGDRAGFYRPGYESYGQLVQRMGQSEHQSCLLLTSRERPKGLARLEGDSSRVHSLRLAGLPTEAGRKILKARGLFVPSEMTAALVERYSGNPLALKLVSATIQDLFGGDVATFLAQEPCVYGDIRDVLDQQLGRLSALEWEMMVWLVIERESISIEDLWDNLARRESRRAFLEALRALRRRSLLERRGEGVTLPNVVIEYVTDHLIHTICQELETETLRLFDSHALFKAQARDYVRESQARLILQPIAERLTARLGRTGLEKVLRRLLTTLQATAPLAPGYAGGNILNLLLHLGIDVRGYDFSRLAVWQAFLRGKSLPAVNFAQADLARSAFTETFSFIEPIAFSPDGRLLAVGTTDGEIRLWLATNRQPYGCFKEQTSLWSIAFSPDGRLLAGGGGDHIVYLWDVHTGRRLARLQGHTDRVWSVAFSPDSEMLASGSEDQTVCLWNVRTGQCFATLRGHSGWVYSVAFGPDGQTLASGSVDQTIRLWNVSTAGAAPKLGHILRGHTNIVRTVAFSPNGQTLASGSTDRTVHLWDVHTGQLQRTLRGHIDAVRVVAFSPDGKTLASGSSDQTVRLWHFHTGQLISAPLGHTDRVRSLAFSPDGQTLASSLADQTIRLWHVRTGQPYYTLRGHTNWVLALAFSPDGESLASGSSDNMVRLWDTRSGQLHHTLRGHSNNVRVLAFSPGGETLSSGSAERTICTWHTRTGRLVSTLQGHTNRVRSLAFSPDGQTLASSGYDHREIHLWDTRTGRLVHTLSGHTHYLQMVVFSPDNQALASSGADHVICLWDVREPTRLSLPAEGSSQAQSNNVHTGQPVFTMQGHVGRVWAIAFSPTGERLASGGGDQTVRLWDVCTGQLCHTWREHSSIVRVVAFSPDGDMLASGSYDQTIRLWDLCEPQSNDVRASQLRHILRGHTGWVLSLAFSPNARILASGSADETIRLWDVRTGQCLKILRAERPYAGMNITKVTGVTATQKEALKALGAMEG